MITCLHPLTLLSSSLHPSYQVLSITFNSTTSCWFITHSSFSFHQFVHHLIHPNIQFLIHTLSLNQSMSYWGNNSSSKEPKIPKKTSCSYSILPTFNITFLSTHIHRKIIRIGRKICFSTITVTVTKSVFLHHDRTKNFFLAFKG